MNNINKKTDKNTERKLFQLIEEAIKQKNQYVRERNALAREILLGIVTGLMLPAALVIPNLPKALSPLLKALSGEYNTSRQNLIYSIQSLKKRELIKSAGKNFKITEKGKNILFQTAIKLIKISEQKKWDKKWRIIIFDIPEKFHNARNALREQVRNMGLYQIQKSAYIYPYPFKDAIDIISQIFGVYEYVVYLEVISIEGEQFLLQHFGLIKD